MNRCHNCKENISYIFIWTVIFLAPLLSLYIHSAMYGVHFLTWKDLSSVWIILAVYLFVFLIHNIFLAPLLIYKKRKAAYFILTTLFLILFLVLQYVVKPDERPGFKHPSREMVDNSHLHESDMRGMKSKDFRGNGPKDMSGRRYKGRQGMEFDEQGVPLYKPEGNSQKSLGAHKNHAMDKFAMQGSHAPKMFNGRPAGGPHGLLLFQQVDVVGFLLMFFMLGMNLGVKLFFKADEDTKRLKELEHKNVEQQLDYLKYQINPHFFMNTLNNIHALVDIDSEEAKTAIVELSKMMRYVLYESDKPLIPLMREVQFLDNYIKLMKLRVADNVPVKFEKSPDLPDASLPPLLLISFVENAFKHGISIEKPSFIDVTLSVNNGRLYFTCKNSKVGIKALDHGGIGLTNVRKRLDLLFGTDYWLDINDGEKEYNVELDFPLNKENSIEEKS
jgi:hypothetical protein